MWTFGHAVTEVERSHRRVVVEETATTRAAALFGLLAVLTLTVFRSAVSAALALFFASFALYARVSSSFTADRHRRSLIVMRRIAWLTFERVHKFDLIDRIYVRRTVKGDGLAVQFKSGRSIDLTMSLGSAPGLDDIAVTLNLFLKSL